MPTIVIIIYMILINIFAFAIMGIDKAKAKQREWRIPEKTLFLAAAFGGAFGANLGMWVFRHKTKHIKFLIIMPLLLILWGAIVYFMIKYLKF